MDTSILELAWALSPYAICGEGNVSVRDDDSFWMKVSGASLTNLGKTEMIALVSSPGARPTISDSPLASPAQISARFAMLFDGGTATSAITGPSANRTVHVSIM